MDKQIFEGIVTDKSTKEDKNGNEFFVFSMKETDADKYAKNFSWFNVDEKDVPIARSIKKGNLARIEFTTSEGSYNGKPITYRNIVGMALIESVTKQPQVAVKQTPKPQNSMYGRDDYWEAKFLWDKENSARISRQATLNTAMEIVKATMLEERNYTADGICDAVILVSEKLQRYLDGDNTHGFDEQTM